MKYYTVIQASNEIGVTSAHIYTLLKGGHIRAINISNSGNYGPKTIRIEKKSIESFIEKRTIDPERYFK